MNAMGTNVGIFWSCDVIFRRRCVLCTINLTAKSEKWFSMTMTMTMTMIHKWNLFCFLLLSFIRHRHWMRTCEIRFVCDNMNKFTLFTHMHRWRYQFSLTHMLKVHTLWANYIYLHMYNCIWCIDILKLSRTNGEGEYFHFVQIHICRDYERGGPLQGHQIKCCGRQRCWMAYFGCRQIGNAYGIGLL